MKIANKHVGKKLTSLLIIKYKLKQLLQCYAILICKIKKNEKPNADDSLGKYLGTASCTIKICSIFLESNLATYNKSLKTNYNL